jgi:hypothetical protein
MRKAAPVSKPSEKWVVRRGLAPQARKKIPHLAMTVLPNLVTVAYHVQRDALWHGHYY